MLSLMLKKIKKNLIHQVALPGRSRKGDLMSSEKLLCRIRAAEFCFMEYAGGEETFIILHSVDVEVGEGPSSTKTALDLQESLNKNANKACITYIYIYKLKFF